MASGCHYKDMRYCNDIFICQKATVSTSSGNDSRKWRDSGKVYLPFVKEAHNRELDCEKLLDINIEGSGSRKTQDSVNSSKASKIYDWNYPLDGEWEGYFKCNSQKFNLTFKINGSTASLETENYRYKGKITYSVDREKAYVRAERNDGKSFNEIFAISKDFKTVTGKMSNNCELFASNLNPLANTKQSNTMLPCTFENTAKCGDIVLCQKATTNLFLERQWGTQGYKLKAVEEAKNRGLSCNVGSDYVEQLTKINIKPTINYNEQCGLNTEDIKQLQRYLQKLNLYTKSIDGILGKSTLSAAGIGKELLGKSISMDECISRNDIADLGELIFANACKADPNECTPRELCSISTKIINNNRVWSEDLESSQHISYVKKLGMNCGVIEVKNPCDLNPNNCKVKELCNKATKAGSDGLLWNLEANPYVAVAKEFGLKCGVIEVAEEERNTLEPSESTELIPEHFKTLSDETICKYASDNGKWYSTATYRLWVIEAKRRGLTCDVDDDLQKAGTNSVIPNNVRSKNGIKEQTLISEAQQILNQLGFKAGPVDGKYGIKTQDALTKFFSQLGKVFDGQLDIQELLELRRAVSQNDKDSLQEKDVKQAEKSISTGDSTDEINNKNTRLKSEYVEVEETLANEAEKARNRIKDFSSSSTICDGLICTTRWGAWITQTDEARFKREFLTPLKTYSAALDVVSEYAATERHEISRDLLIAGRQILKKYPKNFYREDWIDKFGVTEHLGKKLVRTYCGPNQEPGSMGKCFQNSMSFPPLNFKDYYCVWNGDSHCGFQWLQEDGNGAEFIVSIGFRVLNDLSSNFERNSSLVENLYTGDLVKISGQVVGIDFGALDVRLSSVKRLSEMGVKYFDYYHGEPKPAFLPFYEPERLTVREHLKALTEGIQGIRNAYRGGIFLHYDFPGKFTAEANAKANSFIAKEKPKPINRKSYVKRVLQLYETLLSCSQNGLLGGFASGYIKKGFRNSKLNDLTADEMQLFKLDGWEKGIVKTFADEDQCALLQLGLLMDKNLDFIFLHDR